MMNQNELQRPLLPASDLDSALNTPQPLSPLLLGPPTPASGTSSSSVSGKPLAATARPPPPTPPPVVLTDDDDDDDDDEDDSFVAGAAAARGKSGDGDDDNDVPPSFQSMRPNGGGGGGGPYSTASIAHLTQRSFAGTGGSGGVIAPTPLPAMLANGPALPAFRRKRIKRLSKYVLGPLLGEGAYGHVRDAIDLSQTSAERVAIKTIRLRHRSETEHRRLAALLENEIEHLQRFHCAHVIRAVDVFSRDGKQYLALPIAVCSLEQLVAFRRNEILSKRASTCETVSNLSCASGASAVLRFSSRALFPTQLVKDMIAQVLLGLHYLHRQGVAHNDLKPSNCLLFADGVIKIADLASCGTAYRGRGTPAFVSPQVAAAMIGAVPPGGAAAGATSAAAAAATPEPGAGTAEHRRGNGNAASDAAAAAAADASAADEDVVVDPIDARKNDVWACGVVLYYLLTNMLPFHRESEFALFGDIARGEINFDVVPEEFDVECQRQQQHPLPQQRRPSKGPASSPAAANSSAAAVGPSGSPGPASRGGGGNGGSNRFLELPLFSTGLPPSNHDRLHPHHHHHQQHRGGAVASASSVRSLLRQLLDPDQARRCTVAEALQHPWLRPDPRLSAGNGSVAAATGTPKQQQSSGGGDCRHAPPPLLVTSGNALVSPSGGDVAGRQLSNGLSTATSLSESAHALHRVGAGGPGHLSGSPENLRRVVNVREIEAVIDFDATRHLQFVAECCYTVGVPLPPRIFLEFPSSEPTSGRHAHYRSNYPSSGSGRRSGESDYPPPCVDRTLFAADDELMHYANVKGTPEADVTSLRGDSLKKAQLTQYCDALLRDRGYYGGGPPAAAAAKRSAAARKAARGGGHGQGESVAGGSGHHNSSDDDDARSSDSTDLESGGAANGGGGRRGKFDCCRHMACAVM